LEHLREQTRRWIEAVCAIYHVPECNLRLLILGGEAYDRATAARELVESQGMVLVNSHGTPRANPALAIARDASLMFARLVRSAGLLDAPSVAQPPAPAPGITSSPRGRARKQCKSKRERQRDGHETC
jgi:phage terminase small subunit